MKYIKLFENNKDGYEVITHDDFMRWPMKSMVSISERNINIISRILSKYISLSNINVNKNDLGYNYFALEFGDYIFESDDEWFFLVINNRYYKCDQLDGLLNCLKNEFGMK